MMNLTLIGFIKKELNQTLRNPRMRGLLFMAPVIQLTLFGYALSTDIRNIRLAGVYAPQDGFASRLEQRCYASGLFRPVKITGDPYQYVLAGHADAVFVAPPEGLKAAMERGKGQVQLLVDATNSTKAQSVEAYFRQILNDQLKEERKDGGGQGPAGAPAGPGATPPLPIQTEMVNPSNPGQHLELSVRVLYNPSMETSYFMVPGILAMMLLLVTMTLTSSSITREKEMGTFETLIAAPVHKWEIMLGKTVPYIVLGMADIPIILFFATQIFGVPVRGPLWEIALGGLVFVCAMVAVGTLVSTVAKNQQQAMMSSFLITFPAQMLSGIIYPLDNMPLAIKWISYLNPLKYFVSIMRSVTLKGGDPWFFFMNLWPMALIAAAIMFISFRRFHQRLN
jgi:ABC-2 type transport system permease protein